MQESTCPGCHLLLPARPGPTHRYVVSSPECWRIFSETVAAGADPLLSDGYMAQHPDGDAPQQRQSVAVHLVTLKSVLQDGQPIDKAPAITQAAVGAGRSLGGYPKMEPPQKWTSTIADVADGSVDARTYVHDILEAWLAREAQLISEWTEVALARLYGPS